MKFTLFAISSMACFQGKEATLSSEWLYSQDGIDWQELSDLYKAAPMRNKKP